MGERASLCLKTVDTFIFSDTVFAILILIEVFDIIYEFIYTYIYKKVNTAI